eukprot:1286597-Pyramimonas_sp.AAC.1
MYRGSSAVAPQFSLQHPLVPRGQLHLLMAGPASRTRKRTDYKSAGFHESAYLPRSQRHPWDN